MSNYSQITAFTPKDSLITGNPLKLVRGSEFDAEFAAIAVAIATKLESGSGSNPTASVGLAAVNGVAGTFMRSDGAPALSQSIAPTWSGQHQWALPLWASDGTAALPSHTFTNDTDTGMYRNGSDELGFAAGGIFGFLVYPTLIRSNLVHQFVDGAVGSPSLTFTNDTDTGLYLAGANNPAIATAGAINTDWGSGFMRLAAGHQMLLADGVVGTPGLSFTNDTDTGIFRYGTNNLSLVAGGVAQAYISTTSSQWTSQMIGVDGAVGAPSFSFTNDTDTGMYRAGADLIGFAANGVFSAGVDTSGLLVGSSAFTNARAQIESTNVPRLSLLKTGVLTYHLGGDTTTSNDFTMYMNATNVLRMTTSGAVQLLDGTVGLPSFTFISDPDTGLYRSGANAMSVAAGGTAVARFLSTHIDFGASNIPLYLSDGTFGAPALAFNNDTNTGVYRNAADDMVFVAGGNTVARGYLSGGSVPAWQVPDGAVANPGLQFNADPDTGFYRIGSGNIGFSADNSLVFQTLAYASGGAKVADYGGTAQIVGYRQVPRSTTATTLAKNDVAMCVAISAAINIPASVFSAGDAITIYNDSAGALNITISAGTLRLAGSASTGTRSLAARGLATLWFNVGGATPEVICSGSVT